MKLIDFIGNRNWKIRSIDQEEKSEYFFPEFVPCEISVDKKGMLLIQIATKYGLKEILLNFSSISENFKDHYMEGFLNDKVGFYTREDDGIKRMKIYQHEFGNFLIIESFK